MLARRALAQAGFDSVQVVEAKQLQTQTSQLLNLQPENQAAFALAEELGRQVGADVLVATDPDADRVGVEVLQKKMVATSTFQVTKSVLSWLNTSWKLIRVLELFLKMLLSANPSYQLTW